MERRWSDRPPAGEIKSPEERKSKKREKKREK
jgi:hypothetical protein